MAEKIKFSDCFKKTVELLEKTKIDYFIIGGVAVGVWGNPRVTEDIDIIVFVSKKDIESIVDTAQNLGFEFDKEKALKEAKTGVFKLYYGIYNADFIVAISELSKSALKRKVKVEIFNKEVFVASKEDLLLFKLMSGRMMDLGDAEDIAKRYSGKLDEKYLLSWAQKLSDEAEDASIYRQVKRLLRM